MPRPAEHATPFNNIGPSMAMKPGTPIEVRSRFDDRWSAGFEVVAATDTGFTVRRRSDGAELPVVFDANDVRLEQRRKQGLISS